MNEHKEDVRKCKTCDVIFQTTPTTRMRRHCSYRCIDKARYYRDKKKRLAKDKRQYEKHKDEILKKARERTENPDVCLETMYKGMGARIRTQSTYKDRLLLISYEEFVEFAKSTNFLKLHAYWLESGKKKKYA